MRPGLGSFERPWRCARPRRGRFAASGQSSHHSRLQCDGVRRRTRSLILTALPTRRSAGRCRPSGEHDADAGPFAYDRRGAGFLLVAVPNRSLCHAVVGVHAAKKQETVICRNTAPRPMKACDAGRRDVLQSVRKRWRWENETLFEAT